MFQIFREKAERERREKLLRFKEQEIQSKNSRAVKTLNRALNQNKQFLQHFGIFTNQVEDFKKESKELQDFYLNLKREEERLNHLSQELSQKEEVLKDKGEKQRKEDISLHIRRQSIKKEEERLSKKDADLTIERENLKERQERCLKEKDFYLAEKKAFEKKAEKADKKCSEYEKKIADLESREKDCLKREGEVKENSSHLEGLIKENERLKKENEEIKATLEEKIKSYDLRMSDLDSISDTMESIKADASDDGVKAKIVVKEALRSAIKELEDMKDRFSQLDELYAGGTFKGFALPLDEIDSSLESLKNNYQAVKDHALSTGLDFSRWLERIEECIRESDKALSSYLFAQGYRSSIEGLAYCKGYADMIEIFNGYAAGGEDSGDDMGEEDSYGEDDWDAFYQIYFEDEYDKETDYDSFDQAVLDKQYKKLAKKYHPDHAPEDKKEAYENKMAELNKIRDKIKEKFAKGGRNAA